MTYHDDTVELPLEFRPPLIVERPEGSGTYVRLSEDVRNSVVYLGYEGDAEGEIRPEGTGFLIKTGDSLPRSRFLVTAAHVALTLGDDPFYIRFNQRQKPGELGKPQGRLHLIEQAKWFFHPTDRTVDVAVMPIEAPEWAEVLWWPLRNSITEFKLVTKNIGAGDFSYVVGILPYMQGKKRNMPAVHCGHIVLMPDGEKVTIVDWRQKKKNDVEETLYMETDAYLIQATALPGTSGSPVFVRRSLDAKMHLPEIDERRIKVSIPGSLWFLGIWRGAWFGKAPEPAGLRDYQTVPFGVGTAVPAIKLCEVIEQKELVDMRNRLLSKERAKLADTPLGAKHSRMSGDDILRAALNTAPIETPKAKRSKRVRGGVSSKSGASRRST